MNQDIREIIFISHPQSAFTALVVVLNIGSKDRISFLILEMHILSLLEFFSAKGQAFVPSVL
jgi:hypothetical protein